MFFESQPRKPLPGPDTLTTIGKVIGTLFLVLVSGAFLLFIGMFLLFNAALAWIAFRPVPDVPRREVEYTIRDYGPVGETYFHEFREYHLALASALTEQGTLQRLTVERMRKLRSEQQLRNERWVAANPGAVKNRYSEVCVSRADGLALVQVSRDHVLWRGGKAVGILPYQVSGYEWKPLNEGFHRVNGRGVAIGNGRIATGYATSGGTSNPHGRDMGLVWRPDRQQTEDINSRIDAASGWYIRRCLDINERGQILCLGHRTDAKGAEKKRDSEGRLLVLTPLPSARGMQNTK